MVRSFSSEPIAPAVLETLLDAALRSPTAGNTGGTAWVVLEGPTETNLYCDSTTDEAWRRRNPERSEGLRRAPVVLLSYTSPAAYADRYGEPDKADARLASGEWPVAYWFGDAAFGVMAVLLGAVDAGLGACVLGNFRGEAELATRLQVPERVVSLRGGAAGPARRAGPPLALTRPRHAATRRTHPSSSLGLELSLESRHRLTASAPWTRRAPAPPASAPSPTGDPTAG